MNVRPRATAPTLPTSQSDDMPFCVWLHNAPYDEDPSPWKCVAVFRYLSEAIGYIASCQDRGIDVVFQSPVGVEAISAAGKRVVAGERSSGLLTGGGAANGQ